MKALVALEHAILSAVWNMLSTKELCNDPDLTTSPSCNRPKRVPEPSAGLKLMTTQSFSKQQANPPDQT